MGAPIKGLLWRLRATWQIWRPGPGRDAVAPEGGGPFPEAAGKVDQPVGGVLRRGVFMISGWALFPSVPTARVELSLGEHALGRARLGLPRRDVREALEAPLGAAAGFELLTNLRDWPGEDGEALLRASAIAADGERHELPPVRVTVAPAKAPASAGADMPRSPTPQPPDSGGVRTLISTHQLDLGGAQLQLAELLGELLELGTIEPTVVSPFDGPLRERLEAMGVPVHISSPAPLDDLASHLGRVEELVAWTAGRGFELALINTSTANSLPGAEAAEVLGIPAIWLIHESFEPAAIWGHFDPEVRRHAEATLSGAAMAIFETDPTRALYEPLIGAERCLTLPYGLDLEPIEAERDGFDRGAARRQAAIPEDAEVVLCVGTVEPRKAQLPLALAFDLVAARNPKAHLVLVGGCGDDYSRCIEEVVEGLDSAERISLIPITPDVHRWFGLSDLLVCASDIESLPRTVVEAMAWEMPVLATSVFGLPDLVEDGVHGWLCEERDVAALAQGLSRALGTNPDRRRRIGAAGRERVLADYRLGAYGQEVAGLIEQVTGRVGAASA